MVTPRLQASGCRLRSVQVDPGPRQRPKRQHLFPAVRRNGRGRPSRFTLTEILGQNIFGRVVDPVADIEGGALCREITIVESQEVLIVIFEALNGVRNALWEVPDVSNFERLELVTTFFIDCRNGDAACIHVAPFGLQSYQRYFRMVWSLALTTRCQWSSRMPPF